MNVDESEVAIRTMFPEDQGVKLAKMAWLVATATSGARHALTSEIEGEGWEDVYVPEPPAVEPGE
jgi:hypothetical protein